MRRIIAILISITMLFAFAPLSASVFADNTDDSTPVVNDGEQEPGQTTVPGTGQSGEGSGDNTEPTTTAPGEVNEETPETPATQPTTTAPTTAAPTTVPAVKIAGLTSGKGTVTVKWAKPSAASTKTIHIQYCTNKTFKNHVKKTSTSAKNTSKTIKKLINGTYYYVRIRVSAKIAGKTVYSKWSVVKAVKTKGTSPSVKKLSTVYLKVAKGGAKKLKLKKGKGTWSHGGGGVIKFGKKTKAYVTIIPLKAGTETVYCKVGTKTYLCLVRVLNNSVGNPRTQFDHALVVGQQEYWQYDLPSGAKLGKTTYDKKKAKVTIKKTSTTVKFTVKALKPGRFTIKNELTVDGKKTNWSVNFAFINGFRGKTKVKKNSTNYRKWRAKTIDTMVSSGMSTWEIVDAIGKLISSGRYSSKGGATGMQLWYGGNGTCVSGAKMMHDFMNDLGVKSKVHFAGRDKGPKDIFGYYMQYSSGHKNVYITMGGKTYEVNPQPGMPWPVGTVAR